MAKRSTIDHITHLDGRTEHVRWRQDTLHELCEFLVRHMIARVESLDAACKSLAVMVERTTLSVDGVAGQLEVQ